MSEHDDGTCIKCKHSSMIGYVYFPDETNHGKCQYHVSNNGVGGAIHLTVTDDFWCSSGFKYNPNWEKDWHIYKDPE